MFEPLELTGKVRTHVEQFQNPRFAAHPEAAQAFLKMRDAAAGEDIILEPFSSFRDFKTQLRIWNKKFTGDKPLYDMNGVPRTYEGMNEDQIIDCILNWSALPGGSRHQWGTEIDVVDRAAVGPDYHVMLLPEEVAPGGVFKKLHDWLDANMANFGFFRPYGAFQGGMYPEPWHLSYEPVSSVAMDCLTPQILAEALEGAEMMGKARVLERLPQLFEDHVKNITRP